MKLQNKNQTVKEQSPVTVVEKSANAKLGANASCTWVSQASCPKSCEYLNSGCYAQAGLAGIITRRLNKSTETDVLKIAQLEADGIDTLSGKADILRIHVVGDAVLDGCADVISKAAERWAKKGTGKPYTYTHAWRDVKRKSWNTVSVLASCETIQDVKAAKNKGYASALVVAEFEKDQAYDIGEGFKGIPCPAQTKENVTCSKCQMCCNDKRLRDHNLVIMFAAHGSGKKKVKEALSRRISLV